MKWRLRTLGQAGRLSERMRVAPRLFLFLVRSRDFFSFSISWSGTWKYPPLPQNTSSKYSLISDDLRQGVDELNSCFGDKIRKGCLLLPEELQPHLHADVLTVKEERHVSSQYPHGLHSFPVSSDFLRIFSVYDVPVT